MLFQNTILVGVASLASLASAGVSHFTIPKTIVPGTNFTAKLFENNATKSDDISIAFGIVQKASANPGTVGGVLLGKSVLHNTDISPSPEFVETQLSLPDYFEKGEAVVVGAVTALYGVQLAPMLLLHNVTVTVGDKESADIVTSNEPITIPQY